MNEIDNKELDAKIDATLFDDDPKAHIALLAERSRRKGFDLEASLNAIVQCAGRKLLMAYSDIPDPLERSWPQRRFPTWGHLQDLVFYCHAKELPLMSSIIVEQKYQKTGDMAERNLAGFIAAASKAGYTFQDPHRFYQHQQKRTFRYAAGVRGTDLPDGPVISPVDLQRLLLKEGERLSRMVTMRSRAGSVRELCIKEHGVKCLACGIDFGGRFGPTFAGLIEVHHKDPMGLTDVSRLTDPHLDCFPLCPNCHRMAHYGIAAGKCRSLEELTAIISAAGPA